MKTIFRRGYNWARPGSRETDYGSGIARCKTTLDFSPELLGAVDPRYELALHFTPNHDVEVGNDIESHNEQQDPAFDRGDGDGFGFRQIVSIGC